MKDIATWILHLWQSSMIETVGRSAALFVLAGGAVLLLRRAAASARVLVWRLTLAGMVALPALSLLLPPLRINLTLPAAASRVGAKTVLLPSPPTSRYGETPAKRSAAEEKTTAVFSSESSRAQASHSNPSVPESLSARSLPHTSRRPLSVPALHAVSRSILFMRGCALLTPVLFLVWSLGVGLVLLRLMVASGALRQLANRATPAAKNLCSLADTSARESGLKQPVRVLKGNSVDIGLPPMTWGWHRPVIWLPPDTASWPVERVRAVLLHEFAHIARADWLLQHIANLVFACWWFHPGIWLLRRCLRQENERACDDYALSRGISPCEYAAHLLETTKMTKRKQVLSAAASMAEPSLLESRLRSILDTGRIRSPLPRCAVVALMFGAGLCLIPLASLRVSAFRAIPNKVSPDEPMQMAFIPPRSPVAQTSDKSSSEHIRQKPVFGSDFFALPSREKDSAEPDFSGFLMAARPVSANTPDQVPGPEVTPQKPVQGSLSSREQTELDADGIAWGKKVDGLQAGIRMNRKNGKWEIGEQVRVSCYLRNTTASDLALAIPDNISFYDRDRPTIYQAKEHRPNTEMTLQGYDLSTGKLARLTFVLKAGETLQLDCPGVVLDDVRGRRLGATEANDLTPFPFLPDPQPGRYLIQQNIRYERTTPETVERLMQESMKAGQGRELSVLNREGKIYRTEAATSDIGEFASVAASGQSAFEIVRSRPHTLAPAPQNQGGTETQLVWGKPLAGLEGTLRLKENRRSYDGERMEWDYLVRNVTRQPITFKYEPSPGVSDTIPHIVGSDGKEYHAMGWVVLHTSEQRTVTLKPGEIAVVGRPALGINREDTMLSATLHNPGRYNLTQYFHFWTSEKGSQDLMSGPLDFELAGNQDNAAWGNTINGLQAGLSFHGTHARYKVGETIGMDFFVRNTSNHSIRIAYHQYPQFDGLLPNVTDLTGKPADLLALPQGPYSTAYKAITLQPGESMVIGRQALGLQSDDKLKESITLRNGPGRYRINQSIQLFLGGQTANATSLSSGHLEFEVVGK